MFHQNDRKIIDKQLKDSVQTELIRVNKNFADDFLFDNEAAEIPITALRVIFNIISLVGRMQFVPKDQPRQLLLFEEEFQTENNVFLVMKIKNSQISPKRSSAQLIKAYEFLTTFKMGWYSSRNSNGKEIKVYGGLISLPSYQERGYTSFLVSSYWLKKITSLTGYNYILYNLVYNVTNNKHILFAVWLKTIPETGTSVLRVTFNEKFGVNYKDSNDLCFKFLKPIRDNLNLFNDLSFNFSYEKDLIWIYPYLTKTIQNSGLSEKTNHLRLINQRLQYFIKRYSIEEQNLQLFKYGYQEIVKTRDQIEAAYIVFIKQNRLNKRKSTAFKGVMFLQEIQKNIIEIYRATETGKRHPNAYPIIL